MAKRLLCVLLSVLMVVAMLPTGVFAETTASVTYAYSESLLTVSNYWGTTVSGTTVTFGGSSWAEAYVNFGNSVDLSLYDTLTYTVSNVTASSPQLKLYYSNGSNEYPSFTTDGTYSVTLSGTLSYFTIQDAAGEEGGSVTLDSVTLSDSTGTNADLVCTYSESDLTFSNNWGTTVSGNTVTFGGGGYAEAYIDFPSSIDLTKYESIICTVSAASGSTFQLKLYGSDATKYSDSFTAAGDITYKIDTSVIGDTLTRIAVMDTTGTADSSVTITSVTFVAAETPIKQFTSTNSGSDGTYEFKYADYLDSWNEDDTLVITAVLSSPAYFQGIVGANDNGAWKTSNFESSDGSAVTCTLEVVAGTDDRGQIQIYWLNGSYVNLTSLTVEVKSNSSTTPTLYGKTLTLDGSIGVTYYFDMGELDASDYTLKGTLSYDGKSTDVAVSASSRTVTIGGTEYTRYTVPVTIANFLGTIDVDLVDGNGDVVVALDDCSASDYCTAKANDATVGDLCKALVTYAYYADVAVNSNSESTITGYKDMSSYTGASSLTASSDTSGIEKTIVLGDTIYIRIYVDGTANTYTVSGRTVTTGTDNTGAYIEFPVAAKELASDITIYKDGVAEMTYSVYTYVANQLSSSSTASDAVKNLCKAVYYYGQAASSFNAWQ